MKRDIHLIQNNIKDLLLVKGITEVGFVPAKPLTSYANFIVNDHKNHELNYDNSYHKNLDSEEFYNPQKLLKGAKTIITIILPYHMENNNQIYSKNKNYKISKAAIFKDYHHIIEEILSSLQILIQEQYNAKSIVYCDTGPLNDKAVLLQTGDFKILRNSLLWHRKYGSKFYIGYLITDLDISTDININTDLDISTDMGINTDSDINIIKKNQEDNNHLKMAHPYCETCGKCANACPNKAIQKHGHLIGERCISYLTQSNDWDKLTDMTLSGYIYGCDICQMVCPLNKIDLSEKYSYEPVIGEYVELEDIEKLSNREFKAIYNNSSAGWIGKKRFIRNIKENMLGE